MSGTPRTGPVPAGSSRPRRAPTARTDEPVLLSASRARLQVEGVRAPALPPPRWRGEPPKFLGGNRGERHVTGTPQSRDGRELAEVRHDLNLPATIGGFHCDRDAELPQALTSGGGISQDHQPGA